MINYYGILSFFLLNLLLFYCKGIILEKDSMELIQLFAFENPDINISQKDIGKIEVDTYGNLNFTHKDKSNDTLNLKKIKDSNVEKTNFSKMTLKAKSEGDIDVKKMSEIADNNFITDSENVDLKHDNIRKSFDIFKANSS